MYVVMTANEPDAGLIETIDALAGEGVRFIIAHAAREDAPSPVLMRLETERPSVTVLRMPAGSGRGELLKGAFRRIVSEAPKGECVLTLDEDLQKPVLAARAVENAWRKSKGSLVVGSFRYTGKIPFFRNAAMKLRRSIFAVTSGSRVYDIESGLRAFSTDLLEEFIGVKGRSFDYETAILLYAGKAHIRVEEIPMEAPFNASAHRRSFADSWLIYRMILTFMLTSFSCSVIDYATVLVCNGLLPLLHSAVRVDPATTLIPIFGYGIDTKLIALVTGRIIGSGCNFLLNRRVVFKSGGAGSFIRYFTLVAALLAANYGLIHLITRENGLPLWLAQPIVQTVLYPINFILQRKWVFRERVPLGEAK